jgi:hypothetical protein
MGYMKVLSLICRHPGLSLFHLAIRPWRTKVSVVAAKIVLMLLVLPPVRFAVSIVPSVIYIYRVIPCMKSFAVKPRENADA